MIIIPINLIEVILLTTMINIFCINVNDDNDDHDDEDDDGNNDDN